MKQLKIELADSYFESLPGYRLSDIHFKIGSKYHSNTFIHAKGLFQNSFYTSRIGLDLAMKINEICRNNNKNKITLVSYERYSELLLGMIRNFLGTMKEEGEDDLSVHLCVMVDKEGEMRPISYLEEKVEDYFIIVPIVSTGSTTERLKKGYCDEVLGYQVPPLAVYHIFHLCPEKRRKNSVEPLYWIDVDWERPDVCKRCFVHEMRLPLMEADKSNLNPIAVFGLPRVKRVNFIDDPNHNESIADGGRTAISVYGRPFEDAVFNGTLEYHYRNYSEDYRSYSHDPDIFIRNNLEEVKKWLVRLKGELHILPTDKVIVLSPCHEMTNLTFVNMVNDLVFGSAATMICLEPEKEFPENFAREILHFLDSKTDGVRKIIYVDDDLVSGKSFFSIYDMFRHATGFSDKIVMSGAIFLMNKASASTNLRVARAAKSVQSFVAVNLPQLYAVSEMAPSERIIKHFEAMKKRCLYYRAEQGFVEKINRMSKYDDSKSNENDEKRQLQAFLSTHVLYEAFDKKIAENQLEDLTFGALFDICKKMNPHINDRYTLLKVLTKNSFTMYFRLRQRVFDWCGEELDRLCGFMTDPNYRIDKEDLDRLFLLIRRSMVIGNYKIVTKEFLTFLAGILNSFDESGQHFLLPGTTVFGDDSPTSFPVSSDKIRKLFRFYTELILNNGACAVEIRKNLKEVSFERRFAIQFRDALLDETFVVVDDLYNYITKALGFSWKEAFKKGDLVGVSEYEKRVLKWMKKNDLFEDTRFKVANIVVGIADTENNADPAGEGVIITGIKDRFAEYLMIKSLMESELSNKGESHLQDKTRVICDHLKRLVSKNGNVGIFFVIKDILGQYRLIFDYDAQGYEVLFNHFESDPVIAFLNHCFRPLSEDDNMVLEFSSVSKGAFSDMIDILSAEKMVVYRVGSVDKGIISGIIVFYVPDSESISEYPLDAEGRGYMLLLRRDLFDFIDRHHSNEEFIKWTLAEERHRYVYLSGHGKEMMKNLKDIDKTNFAPIVAIQDRLQRIFSDGFTDDSGIIKSLNGIFNQEDFDNKTAKQLIDYVATIMNSIYEGKAGNVVEFSESPIYVKPIIEGTGKISFDVDLLKFICFELIVNAKKNRFFIVPGIFEEVYGPGSFKNSIAFKLSFSDAGLVISVTGTGPKVPQKIQDRINKCVQIKRGISGLDLIIKLIKQYNKKNELSFSDQKEGKHEGVYYNTMNVHLYNKNSNGGK